MSSDPGKGAIPIAEYWVKLALFLACAAWRFSWH